MPATMEKPVRVTSGATSIEFAQSSVAGKTVDEIKKMAQDALNVGNDQLVAYADGKEVKSSFVLGQVDTLEFVKPVGEKG